MKKIILLSILFLWDQTLFCTDWSSLSIPSFSEIGGSLKSVSSGALNILEGFAGGFGVCLPDKKYSMCVWNDVPEPVLAIIQNITSLLGAQIAGQAVMSVLMDPFTNTGTGMNNLSGVCNGAVYLARYSQDTLVGAGYKDLFFAGEQTGEAISGAGGTTVYVIANLYSIWSTVVGLVTGEGLYVDETLSNESFFNRKFTAAAPETDDTSDDTQSDTQAELPVYYYRGYFDKGEAKGEFLNSGLGESTDFAGIFYNSSSKNAKFTFQKDGKTYTVTLDPSSFNALSSTPDITNSIRPPADDDTKDLASRRSFKFDLDSGTITIPIASTGIGDVYTDTETNESTTVGRNYTFEIFDDTAGQNLGIQGLQIGNYDQAGVVFETAEQAILAKLPNIDANPDDIINWSPEVATMATTPPYTYPLLTNVRDINPVTLSIWYQTAEAASASDESDASVISYNPPYTFWISYDGADSTVLQKILPGQAIDLTVFRPQITEGTANLYVFALDTDDQTKAQQFFDNLFKAGEPQSYYTQIKNPLDIPPDGFTIRYDTYGVINDSASGVIGMFILKDIFNTSGIGSGPFYYTIPPTYLVLTQLATTIGTYLAEGVDSSPTDILSWITYFVQNKDTIAALNITDATSPNLQQAVPALTSFLQTNGSDSTQENLNGALYNLLYGPTSLTHLPIIWQAGSNTFTTQPDGWPQPATDQSQPATAQSPA